MQPLTNNKQSKSRSWLLSTLLFAALTIAAAGLIITNQRAIADYLLLRNYQAPANIAQIAQQDKMTDKARHIFYVNHPSINERASFITACPNSGREQTIVLGCYQSDQSGIFLLNVTDQRLDGVKQVTAAHEMLHAAYDRLNGSQRNTINSQLMAYYENGLKDERIKTTIDAYKKSEPNDIVNEMHSIFGTEVGQLPAGLEQYYKQYFVNRSAVIGFSARYEAEFTSRKNQVIGYDAQLKNLKSQIEGFETDLEGKQATIVTQQASLKQERNNNNIAAYNAGVPVYNSSINAYNAEIQQVRGLILQYNQIVNTRNAVAVEEDQLVQSLQAQNQTINN